jgi:hypothetical protein
MRKLIGRDFTGRSAKRFLVLGLIAFSTVCAAATSPIGRPLKFYESNVGKNIFFRTPAEACTPGPYNACIFLNEWGYGTYSNIELGTVNVSGSYGRSTVCLNEIGNAVYVMKGASSEPDLSTFNVEHRYELQSAVLDNPSLINPKTGVAFNGKISIYSNRGFSDQDYIKAGQRMVRNHSVSSFECGTPLMNYTMLTTTYGLSSLTAQYLLSQPMTIRLYVSGYLMATEGGFYTMQLRVIGD